MKKLTLLLLFSFYQVSFAFTQTPTNLSGLRFQQYQKDNSSYAILEFSTNKQVSYVMGGMLPMSGKSYKDACTGTYSVSGNKITIKCTCSDKDLFPDPIEDSFQYDSKTKTLTSTRYKYTVGSAPSSGLAGKFTIWNQL